MLASCLICNKTKQQKKHAQKAHVQGRVRVLFFNYLLLDAKLNMKPYTLRLATLLAALCLMIGISLPMQAQAQSQLPFDIGARGGLAQATFYGDDVKINDWRTGFTGGVFATYDIYSFLSIQPEIIYSVRGSKDLDYRKIGGPEGLRFRKDILEIPILIKLGLPLSQISDRLPETVIPRGYVGPALGFIVNTEVTGEDADQGSDDTLTSPDIGGVVGAELAYAINQGPLSEIAIDGRYNIGVANLGDVDEFNAVHSMSFVGTLSLRFSI